MTKPLRIGTRQSPLAIKQTEIIVSKLKRACPDINTEIIPISTAGDEDKTTPLWQIGGKGVFIKTLEKALLNDAIDIAVHSLKDVTSELPETLCLAAFLEPESCADVLVLKEGKQLSDLKEGAKIGTSSLRRKALLKRDYGHLNPVDIRGNVQTRIDQVLSGSLDGVILSEAGLIRLDLESHISHRFDPDVFLPAPGQGVIAVECHENNELAMSCCAKLTDAKQHIISEAELLFLKTVGFDCRDPLGLRTVLEGETLRMTGFKSDGEFNEFFDDSLTTEVYHNTASIEAFSARFRA